MAEKSTTKKALKKLDAQLECPLCLETFKEPKLLPCFHVFCKSPCLEKLVIKDGEQESLCCPTCRHIVPLSEKGVAGLQSDFHIEHLFEIQHAFGKVADSSETECGSCDEGKATGYCRDCGQFVCDDCQAAHRKIKIWKNHQVITLEEVQVQATSLVPPKKAVPRCPKHSNKKLKIYCETCKELICNDCTIRLHKDHEYDLVTDVFLKHKEEIVSSLKPVKEKLEKVQQALDAFDARAREINEQRVTLEADVHKQIDQQKQSLDQRRVELVSELDLLTQQKLKRLAAQRDQVEISKIKLSSCLEYTEGGLRVGNEGEVLSLKNTVLRRIEQVTTEFGPDTILPETEADIQLRTTGKEKLQEASQEFIEIIESSTVSTKDSYITGNDLNEATTGEQKSVTLLSMTKSNNIFEGKLHLTAGLVHVKSKFEVKCEVDLQAAGQYHITYQPVKRGRHNLCITINESPVRGSPYPIVVSPSPQSLCKPVRVVQGLKQPRGTTINNRGQTVVVENSGSCISVLTPAGEKVCSFGTRGSGNGQLSGPTGLAVDKDNNIYVSDYGNHRIQKFTSEGEFVAAVGTYGNKALQFSYPVGITYNYKDNNLYAVDQSNHRIQVLSTDLTFVRCFGTKGNGNGQFWSPSSCDFDDAMNYLYVAEYDNHRVQVLTAEGQFIKVFSSKANNAKLLFPYSITIDSSNTVYVSELNQQCVSVYSAQGEYITSFGTKGTGEGQFNCVYGLCIDHDDSLIVSDCNNGRIQVF